MLKQYVDFKKANPTLPVLIREAAHTEARVFARYGLIPLSPMFGSMLGSHEHTLAYGKERHLNFDNASEAQVQAGLLDLITNAPAQAAK